MRGLGAELLFQLAPNPESWNGRKAQATISMRGASYLEPPADQRIPNSSYIHRRVRASQGGFRI